MPFQKIRQPQTKKDINNLDESIGFQFMRQPEVKSEIKVIDNKLEIKINEFRSQSESGIEINNFDTLSAIFIDNKYNGSDFILTNSFFADELVRSDDCLQLPSPINIMSKKTMIIYIDIYGNEFKELYEIKE